MVEARKRPAGPKPRPAEALLVIDDEELIRETLAEYLAGQGFDVEASRSGEDGLERAARRPFAIALCDMQLPGIGGLEVLERLRQLAPELADTFGPATPVEAR